MGYLSIQNLYKVPGFLECYCLEKIMGSSSHISFTGNDVRFFAGGASHEVFCQLFDKDNLLSRFQVEFGETPAIVYGEAFGTRRLHAMEKVYGNKLRFIAFDVKVNDLWLSVPDAEAIVKSLGLDFVPYERGPLTLEFLNEQRDRPSLVAIVPDAIREGIVIRPIHEMRTNDGERVIYKHKRDEFKETKTSREVTSDPEKVKVLQEANAVADEWVVEERLRHVLDKTPFTSLADTSKVIKAMIDDVRKESVGEIVWSKDVEKAIGRSTAKLLHSKRILFGEAS